MDHVVNAQTEQPTIKKNKLVIAYVQTLMRFGMEKFVYVHQVLTESVELVANVHKVLFTTKILKFVRIFVK